jgi:hypothetical protein
MVDVPVAGVRVCAEVVEPVGALEPVLFDDPVVAVGGVRGRVATVRHRTKITRGSRSWAAERATAFKFIVAAQYRSRESTDRIWSRRRHTRQRQARRRSDETAQS